MLKKNAVSIVIDEFNKYLDRNLYWRVDWLENPYEGGSHRIQPMLNVHLSPLNPDRETPVITHPDSADASYQGWVSVGVGYLPILYIGAVFKGGSPVALRPEQAIRMRLDVLPALGESLPLGRRIPSGPNKGQRIIESEHFAVGKAWWKATDSLVLSMPDERAIDPNFVTIPAIEVARFFCCLTSVLSRSLFSHAWSDLIYQPKCDKSGLPREIIVGLKQVKGLRYLDARHLAFFLCSEKTREMVQGIHQSLQVTSQSDRNAKPLDCKFPFDKKTRIVAEVVKIQTDTPLGHRFFVTRLLSCERPIPFEICYAYPQLHPGQGENRNDSTLKDARIGGPKASGQNEPSGTEGHKQIISNIDQLMADGFLSDADGNPANSDQIVQLDVPEERFPGLQDVPTTLAPKAEQEYRNAGGKKNIPAKGKGLSTGTPQGSKPIVPANLNSDAADGEKHDDIDSPAEGETADPFIELLRATVPILRSKGHTASELKPCNLTWYKKSPEHRRAWQKIQIGTTQEGRPVFRSRLLVAIYIELPDFTIIVAEIERRTHVPEFGISAFRLMRGKSPEHFLAELAKAVVTECGWPPFKNLTKNFGRFTLGTDTYFGWKRKHNQIDTAVVYSDKLQKLFELTNGSSFLPNARLHAVITQPNG